MTLPRPLVCHPYLSDASCQNHKQISNTLFFLLQLVSPGMRYLDSKTSQYGSNL